jgi:hypothetical protein
VDGRPGEEDMPHELSYTRYGGRERLYCIVFFTRDDTAQMQRSASPREHPTLTHVFDPILHNMALCCTPNGPEPCLRAMSTPALCSAVPKPPCPTICSKRPGAFVSCAAVSCPVLSYPDQSSPDLSVLYAGCSVHSFVGPICAALSRASRSCKDT